MSVFRARSGGDPNRERDKETTIDRCDVSVDDGPGRSSRLIARIVCRNGKRACDGKLTVISASDLPQGSRPRTHYHLSQKLLCMPSSTLRKPLTTGPCPRGRCANSWITLGRESSCLISIQTTRPEWSTSLVLRKRPSRPAPGKTVRILSASHKY